MKIKEILYKLIHCFILSWRIRIYRTCEECKYFFVCWKNDNEINEEK